MKRIVYFEEQFSTRREELIEYCCNLHKQGKRFLYILPSKEAIRYVRYAFFDKIGGLINSHVITTDELEKIIVKDHMEDKSLIDEAYVSILLKEICSINSDKLQFYKKICTKKGFIRETTAFIKSIKRNNIALIKLHQLTDETANPILRKKLKDLSYIYSEYNKKLQMMGLYDINDISIKAVELVETSDALEDIDTIIIDGFINIDKINIELFKEIAQNKTIDIFVNASLKNSLTTAFLHREIIENFEGMGFTILQEALNTYEIKNDIERLAKSLYNGEKIEDPFNSIEINKYPTIEDEVRETARSIKKKLMVGEKIEEIAVYINSLDEYRTQIYNVFQEFNIPCDLAKEVTLIDANEIREMLLSFANIEVEQSLQEWVHLLEDKIQQYANTLQPVYLQALREDLASEDKLRIKANGEIKKIVEELTYHLKMTAMMNEKIKGNEFYEMLLELTETRSVVLEKGKKEGIRILNTDYAKGIFYNHVYLIGLNEGTIPKVTKNNGLLVEEEVQFLHTKGINYRNYEFELNREKIRFNLALASARESITLSYRNADEKGALMIASPFIDEVKFVTGLKENKSMALRERFQRPADEVMSGYELKTILLRDIFENLYKGYTNLNIEEKINFMETYERDIKNSFFKGLIQHHREQGSDFNHHEAVFDKLEIPRSLTYLTPSAMGAYFSCPYRYFIQQELKLSDMVEEEDAYSPLEIGQFYHGVLYNYFNGLAIDDIYDRGGKHPTTVLQEDRLHTCFQQEVMTLRELEMYSEEKERLLAGFWNTLHSFMKLEIDRLNKFSKETKGNILHPFLLETKAKNTTDFGIPISCKIDRVDLEYTYQDGEWKPTGKYLVYDYKKRKIADIGKVLNREDCQLAIYYYVIKDTIRRSFPNLSEDEIDCMGLIYVSIEEQKKTSLAMDGLYRDEYKKSISMSRKHHPLEKQHFHLVLEYVKGLVKEAIDDIQKGIFHYSLSCDEFDSDKYNTGYNCSLKDVCRHNKHKASNIR